VKYRRELDPTVLAELRPHIIAPDERSRVQMMEGTLKLMSERPETIFIFTARDEEGMVTAFAIAQALPGIDHVWLDQCWSHKDNPPTVSDTIFTRLILWAISMGKNRVRAETKRSITPLVRRWGFDEVSKIIEHKITEDPFERYTYGRS
jgi:hypothetical protein